MTLEDFERQLAQEKAAEHSQSRQRDDEGHHKHRHRHHRSTKHGSDKRHKHHHRHKHHRGEYDHDGRLEERHNRDKHSRADESPDRKKRRRDDMDPEGRRSFESTERHSHDPSSTNVTLQRDAWMEAPPEFEYLQTAVPATSKPQLIGASEVQEGKPTSEGDVMGGSKSTGANKDSSGQEKDDYIFGDAGSGWRMTKLKAVYSQAHDTGRSVEETAIERYGDLQSFDEAREEETELERRQTYGSGYIGKERPVGDLYRERKPPPRPGKAERSGSSSDNSSVLPHQQVIHQEAPVVKTTQLDQTALNRLKAQMMKAKLRNSPDFPKLEAEYTAAMAGLANRKEPDIVILGARESRMLAGKQQGGIARPVGKAHDNPEDMTIEEMVREERMMKGQAGGEGRRFAERIAKDRKFNVRFVNLQG